MTPSEIQALTDSDRQMREFAEALAPHLAPHLVSRMGPYVCKHFTDAEAVGILTLIKWGRVAVVSAIVGGAGGVGAFVVTILTGG